MDFRQHVFIMVVSVVAVVSVGAADPKTENLLSSLAKSKLSIFTTTSDHVYHMEADQYRPGYVIYTDQHALKTSDGNNTEIIAGHPTTWGYKEGVLEEARFGDIFGFTQISPTKVIVLDYNHCLRQVDRIRRVTSLFAGQCGWSGSQDGASPRFWKLRAVIVDKKNSKQLLVADHLANKVRTVDVENRSAGTFIEFKSDQLDKMEDIVQDKITGDLYITAQSKSLYKLSYNTKTLNAIISYGVTGVISGKHPGDLFGLFMLDTVLLVVDPNNKRILKYDTDLDLWSALKVCDATKTHTNTDDCVIDSARSILLTNDKLLIGGNKKITSYGVASSGSIPPTPSSTLDIPSELLSCPKKLVAVTSPENGLATFQLKFDDQDHTLMLPLGQHPYIIKSSDQICNVTLDAKDYRVRHTLELVADYSVDCSVVNSTVAWSLLNNVVQKKYSVVEAVCGSACKRPDNMARPLISCDGVDDLKIRWPTDLVFAAGTLSVPAEIRQKLESNIRHPGVTMDIVVLGATPLIVYPRKAANGGYVSISLSTTCINSLTYSDIERKCG